MNFFHTNGSGDGYDGSGYINEGCSDNEEGNKERGLGRRDHNRFKVYHRKLDFSHVGSKVRQHQLRSHRGMIAPDFSRLSRV